MREFFRGWQRKVGVLTLVTACVLTAGWIGSTKELLAMTWPRSSHSTEAIVSAGGLVSWQTRIDCDPVEQSVRWHSQSLIPEFNRFRDPSTEWQLDILGILVGVLPSEANGGTAVVIRVVPYWLLVVPVTLASAWLLLSQTRVLKPNTESGS